MKYFFLAFILVGILVVVIAGPQGQHSARRPLEFFPDMVRQPKIKPQSPSTFFANGIGPRRPVEGTVPMGFEPPAGEKAQGVNVARVAGAEIPPATRQPSETFSLLPDYLNTGKMGDQWGTGIPLEVTPALLARGQERFGIYCAVCHGATGGGNGVTSKYNWVGIANYHDERIVKMADGEIFNTITNGKNTMLGYGANVRVEDRWAIIAYIRVLQRAQRGTVADLTPEQRAALK